MKPKPETFGAHVQLYRRGHAAHWQIAIRLSPSARRRFLQDPAARQYGLDLDARGRIRKSLGSLTADAARALAADFEAIADRYERHALTSDFCSALLPAYRRADKTIADLFAERAAEETKRVAAGTLEARTSKTNASLREYLRRYLRHIGATETLLLTACDHQWTQGLKLWFLGEGYHPATWNQLRHYLSGLWSRAVKYDWTEKNPWDDADLHEPAGEAKPATPLTVEQAHALYRRGPDEANDACLFLLLTGARPSDAVSITVTQIDLAENLIRCRQPKLKRHPRQTKLLIITPELRPVIERQLARHRGASHLFPRADGAATDRHYAIQRWGRHLKAALDNRLVSPKSFRVNFETKLGQVGIPQQLIDKLMGHTTGHVREHYIAHEIADLRAAAVRGVADGIFGGIRPHLAHTARPSDPEDTAAAATGL